MDRPWQTVQTQIRLLLQEQSDQGLHCLLFHLHLLTNFSMKRPFCLNFRVSRVMRKPTFCICENKDADQLRGHCEADQRLCFRYMNSSIPILSIKILNFKTLAIFCSCTVWFVSDQVRNQYVGFLMMQLRVITANIVGI